MRRLLLLLLVPVIWTTATIPAEAVEPAYGNLNTFTVEGDGSVSGQVGDAWLKCNASVRYKAVEGIGPGNPVSLSVVGSIWCKVSREFVGDPDWDGDDSASHTLSFHGDTPGEPQCTLTHSTTNLLETSYQFETTSTLAACPLTEFCIDASWNQSNWGPDIGYDFDLCTDITMGSIPTPEAETGTCANGMPMFYEVSNQGWPSTTRYYYPFEFGLRDRTSSPTWNFAEYWQGAPYTVASKDRSRNTGSVYAMAGWDNPPGSATATFTYEPYAYGASALGNSTVNQEPSVYGVEIYAGTRPSEVTYPVGVTVPEVCLFWIGPKIVDIPDTEIDEPYLPLGPVEPPEPPDTPVSDPGADTSSCNFKFSDPASWLEGGMCAAVGLLGKIVGLLGQAVGYLAGLASAIVGPIVDALLDVIGAIAGIAGAIIAGLWDFLEPNPAGWDIDGLVEQLQTRPPFSLIEPLADEATGFASSYTSAGSCGVLADFGDAEVTCSDIQSAPGLSVLYEVVRIGLVVLTGWGLFRMFSQLFEDQG